MNIHSEIEISCTADCDYCMIIISSSISSLQSSMICCLQHIDISQCITLYALTFYGQQHYTCKIKFYGKWVHYDGLKEKQCPGSSLFEQYTAQLGTPLHCFYVQL